MEQHLANSQKSVALEHENQALKQAKQALESELDELRKQQQPAPPPFALSNGAELERFKVRLAGLWWAASSPWQLNLWLWLWLPQRGCLCKHTRTRAHRMQGSLLSARGTLPSHARSVYGGEDGFLGGPPSIDAPPSLAGGWRRPRCGGNARQGASGAAVGGVCMGLGAQKQGQGE